MVPHILVSLHMSLVKAFMVKFTVAPLENSMLTIWWSTTSLSQL